MTLEELEASLTQATPSPALSLPLQALWHDARGDWDAAHGLAQRAGDEAGAWVHAYLHRKEGDTGNAQYWYSRAGHSMPRSSLEEEWRAIAGALLAGQD